VIAIGVALADALEHAHQRGVIHCDIKPENVLLDADGRPLLGDFSIARVIADARTTAHNRGTPYFIAPEVLAGRSPDVRSDVFVAAGAIATTTRARRRSAVRASAGSEPPGATGTP
jgi:serine/threonine protein kinase